MTFVLAVLDSADHEVTLVNAGHMAPLLCGRPTAASKRSARRTGVPLGVDADYRLRGLHAAAGRRRMLTLFTDGISEAMNAARATSYGLERISEQLQTATHDDVVQAGQADPRRRQAASSASTRKATTCAWSASAARE